jgi:hypothetical protein
VRLLADHPFGRARRSAGFVYFASARLRCLAILGQELLVTFLELPADLLARGQAGKRDVNL